MHKSSIKIIIALLIIVLIVVMIVIIGLNIYEKFSSESILVNDLKDNADFQECLNRENQIKFLSNGQYETCSRALSQLSTNGINPQEDIGFGKISELCPLSSLASSPSSCLNARLNKQNITIDDTTKLINESPQDLQLKSLQNKFEFDSYKKQFDKLLANDEILKPIKYIQQNRLKTSNDPFEPVLNDIVNPMPSPTPSLTPDNTLQTTNNPDSQFNDTNMLLQINPEFKLKVLGY